MPLKYCSISDDYIEANESYALAISKKENITYDNYFQNIQSTKVLKNILVDGVLNQRVYDGDELIYVNKDNIPSSKKAEIEYIDAFIHEEFTSNNTPANIGKITSSNNREDAWKIFSNNEEISVTNNETFTIELEKPKQILDFLISSNGIGEVQIEGSTDNSNFTLIAKTTNIDKKIIVDLPEIFKYYKLIIYNVESDAKIKYFKLLGNKDKVKNLSDAKYIFKNNDKIYFNNTKLDSKMKKFNIIDDNLTIQTDYKSFSLKENTLVTKINFKTKHNKLKELKYSIYKKD